MKNPFTISFGNDPLQYISRITQTNKIIDDFRSETPSTHVYMITGVRGSGKTVMMSQISDEFAKDGGWISIELNPELDMLQSLAASLYSIPYVRDIVVKAKLDFSVLGIGATVENGFAVYDIDIAIRNMLEKLSEAGKRLLVTIDEVTVNHNIKVFMASFQIYLRKKYQIFLLMTGLYDNIYDLQNEDSMTFLYRAPKILLEPLNHTAIREKYKKLFDISADDAEQMAYLTRGYSFAFQVLGYLKWERKPEVIDDILPEYDQYLSEYVYDKIWSETSATDRRVLHVMATSGETKIANIRERLDMPTPEFSVYRDRLKRKGVIDTRQYGYISLILPRFEEYISDHM